MKGFGSSVAPAIMVVGLFLTCRGTAAPDTPKAVFLVSFPTNSFTEEALATIQNCCSMNNTTAVNTCAKGEECETIRLVETKVSGGWDKYTIIFDHPGKEMRFPQSFSGSNEGLYHLAVMHKLELAVTCHLFAWHSIPPKANADSDFCKHCVVPPQKLPQDLLQVRKDKR
jgi:hypothetical protein